MTGDATRKGDVKAATPIQAAHAAVLQQLAEHHCAVSLAVAKQMPCAPGMIAVFTRSRPRASRQGPPELPGLSAASVWIDIVDQSSSARTQAPSQGTDDAGRDRVLRSRADCRWQWPHWPIRSAAERAKCSVVKTSRLRG